MSGYDIGYYVSMAVAILSAMVAIFLFFFLDIRQAIKMSSGQQRRKRIQEKAVQYSKHDVSDELSAGHNPMYISVSEEITDKKKGRREKKTGHLTADETPVGENMKGTPIQPTPGYHVNPVQSVPQTNVTSVLRQGTAGNMTTVLQEPGRNLPTMAPNRRFEVIQNIIVIHTNERI